MCKSLGSVCKFLCPKASGWRGFSVSNLLCVKMPSLVILTVTQAPALEQTSCGDKNSIKLLMYDV